MTRSGNLGLALTIVIIVIGDQWNQPDAEGYSSLYHLLSGLRDRAQGERFGHIHHENHVPKVSADQLEWTLSTGTSQLHDGIVIRTKWSESLGIELNSQPLQSWTRWRIFAAKEIISTHDITLRYKRVRTSCLSRCYSTT